MGGWEVKGLRGGPNVRTSTKLREEELDHVALVVDMVTGSINGDGTYQAQACWACCLETHGWSML